MSSKMLPAPSEVRVIDVPENPPYYGTLLPLPGEKSPGSSDTDISGSMTSLEIEQQNANMQKVNEELASLSEKTGMPVTQENGQRKFGPPKDCKIVPPKGCEVFVGKIPRDCFEPELVPVFERVGKIYEMRLMMDFSGTNRGYCFVQYFQPVHAQTACKELNHFEIRKGRAIGVVKSVDNCRLFIGGIPKDKTENDILEEVARITDGVVRVIVYPSVEDKNKNRGFAFIEYENHKAAAMARRKMIPGKTPMWGMSMCVDWAEPEPDVDSEIMSKVQVLYARNLMVFTTEDTLAQLFNEVSANGVERVKKMKDYAFIHFASREQAEEAKNALNGQKIDGSPVEICWSKPVDKTTYRAQRAQLQRGQVHRAQIQRVQVQRAQAPFYPVPHAPPVMVNQLNGTPIPWNQLDGYLGQQMQLMPGFQLNRMPEPVYYM